MRSIHFDYQKLIVQARYFVVNEALIEVNVN